ncbi:hypothetical protein D770_20380 [Flammeovirgaceae bacterium 311]|nr:hypothetical protein D770_20380 [Flammeovirgaceae bacterium 311]
MIVVHVPVSEAVKKYLIHEFAHRVVDHREGTAIKVNRRHLLGNIMAMGLTSDLSQFKPQRIPKQSLAFILDSSFVKNACVEEWKLEMISQFLDQFFKQSFCMWLKATYEKHGDIVKAIDAFYERYDLSEDDYGRDNLRRYYNAHLTGKWGI